MKTRLLLIPAMVLGLCSLAQADVAGQVQVKMKIDSGCTVNNVQSTGTINTFGDLNFGTTDVTWANILTAQVNTGAGTGELAVSCGKANTPFQVSINGGVRGNRTMKHTTATDTVTYNVYRDASRNTPFVINTPESYTTALANTLTPVPVYGSVPTNAATPKTVGDYNDTLLVNFTF